MLKKVLLIEDDLDQITMYETEFKLAGLDILSAADGVTGIKIAVREQPGLIFLDVVMKDMDGIETLKKLKTEPTTKNIPVIMLSNLSKQDVIDKSFQLEAADYLIKASLEPKEVVSRAKEILERDY